jgi:predicted MFS family arabinose efflux permease
VFDRGIANLSRAFANRDFARFTAGNAVSLLGMWGLRIAVGWLAWELTASAFWVGVVAFADLFPTIVVTPFAGAIADRRSRLRIVRVTQAISVGLVSLLALVTATGVVTIELLALLVLANGVTMGFKQPSRMALTRALVRPDDLPTAIAINAIVFNLARFAGPSLGGLLIVTMGVEAVFVFDALTSLWFLAVIRPIHVEPPAPRGSGRRGLVRDIAQGVRYAAGHPGIGPIMLLLVITGVAMRGYIELLPVYSAEILDRGADGLAMMSAGIGVGAMLAALYLAQREGAVGLTRLAITGHVVAGASLLLLALAPNLPSALVAVVASGFAIATAGVASQTLTQRVVDEAVLGRVMSLYGVIFRAGPAAGALLMGTVADLTGLRTPFVAGATITLAACALLGGRLLGARWILEEGAAPAPRGAD